MRLLLAALLLIPSIALAAFLDTNTHPHRSFIEELQSYNLVQGYGSGLYRPDITVNRAEFLKVLMGAVFGQSVFDVSNRACFADFDGEEQWYWVYACKAKELGIVSGYPQDGTFRGSRTVNLVEALKMTIEAWEIPTLESSRVPGQLWYKPYTDIANIRGLLEHFPANPGHLLTRSEMAVVIAGMGEELAFLEPEEDAGDAGDAEFDPFNNPLCGNGVIDRGEECDDGNVEDGDGCSSICVVVPEPIRHGALRIEQMSTLTADVAAGAKQVLLHAFQGVAGRQDVQLTQLKYIAASGDLTDFQNYTLYADLDNDGSAETAVGSAVPQNGVLTFSSLYIPLPEGIIVRTDVRADLRSGVSSGDLQLQFATADPAYIEAVGLADGSALTGITTDDSECTDFSVCWIAVYTTSTSGTIGFREKGDLFVTQSPSPVPSRQILGGTTSEPVLRIRMRADGEDIEVTKMRISGGTTAIDRLELREEGVSGVLATATQAQCGEVVTGLFCTATNVTIANNEEKSIEVRAVAKADTNGGSSGGTATFSMTLHTDVRVAVEARGVQSNEALLQNDGDGLSEGEVFIGTSSVAPNSAIVGSANDLVLAKITEITNIHSDSDGTPVPVGQTPIATFRFSAASHANTSGGSNDVVIDRLVFTVAANNVRLDLNSLELFNVHSSGITHSCTATENTGTAIVTCNGLEASSISTVVEQGRSLDLALQVTVLNPQVNSSSSSTLQASLNSLGNRNAAGTVEWNDEVTDYGWVDISSSTVRSTVYRTN